MHNGGRDLLLNRRFVVKKLIKAFLRNFLVHPFILCNYRLTICGLSETLGSVDSAIVVINHVSLMDAPLLVSAVWPIQVCGAVWYEEYAHPLQYPFFKLFDAISVGSPKHLSKEKLMERKEKALHLLVDVLAGGAHVAISPEGGIGDGAGVKITPHFSGLHDLILAQPAKPVVLVTIRGLERSRFGRSKQRPPSLWKRLPITVTFQRVDHVSLEGGPAGLHRRLEQYFNQGISLAQSAANAA